MEPMLEDGRVATLSNHRVAILDQHRNEPVKYLIRDRIWLAPNRNLINEVHAAGAPRRPKTPSKQRGGRQQQQQHDGTTQHSAGILCHDALESESEPDGTASGRCRVRSAVRPAWPARVAL